MTAPTDKALRRFPRVKILTTYPDTDASRRLRIDPLVKEFNQRGLTVFVDEIFTRRAYKWKNAGRLRRIYSALIVAARLTKRLAIILLPLRTDIVLVHREAFPFFTPTFERLVARNATLAALDVDDAIHHNVTHGRDWRRFLRKPENALEYSTIFDIILCGNNHLMEIYGAKNSHVAYAPTCPERVVHEINPTPMSATYDVVWIGSQSTLPSLREYMPAIRKALEQTSSKMLILGGHNVATIEADNYVETALWSAERELSALRTSRIGIMPLPDTEWERGKSGYKAIMYLCAGLAAVISPVGFNRILCEQYGAIPCQDDDWTDTLVEALSRPALLTSQQLSCARAAFDSKRVASVGADAIIAAFDAKIGCTAE